jgi:hypothetical protein
MEADMLGWIFGTLLLIILVVKVLDYLDLVDFVEAIGAILKLAVGLVALLTAFFFWSARKLIAVARASNPTQVSPDTGSPDDGTPLRRGGIETRNMARRRAQK